MSGVNKVTIVGNIGKIETFVKASGTTLSMSVATSESYIDKQSGEKITKTEWHNIVVFGKLAEALQPYLVKGKQVYVEGKLQTDSYEKDGEKRYSTKIIAREIQLLGLKSDSAPPVAAATAATAQQYSAKDTAAFDDSIPF